MSYGFLTSAAPPVRKLVTLFAFVCVLVHLTSCSNGVSKQETLEVVVVLDSSGSWGTAINTLKSAVKSDFVSNLTDGTGGDRLGVVVFSTDSQIAVPIDRTIERGFNRAQVESAIDSMVPGGWTATSDAIRKAMDELRGVPAASRSDLRVMLVVTDGVPNTLAMEHGGVAFNLSPGSIYMRLGSDLSGLQTLPLTAVGNIPTMGRLPITADAPLERCVLARANINVTENIAQRARQEGIVVYTIGVGRFLDVVDNPSCGLGNEDTTSALLRHLANVPNTENQNRFHVPNEPSGLYCQANAPNDLEECFQRVISDLHRRSNRNLNNDEFASHGE